MSCSKKIVIFGTVTAAFAVILLSMLILCQGREDIPQNTLDSMVSDAILAKHTRSAIREEAHYTLSVRENPDNTVTVFTVAHYEEYRMNSELELLPTSGGTSPAAITFAKENGKYVCIEYWKPWPGEGYRDSLLERFSEEDADKIDNMSVDLTAECRTKAQNNYEYYKELCLAGMV